MRADVFMLLLFIFSTAHGGGPVKERKKLQGYDPTDRGYPNDTSPCHSYRGTKRCFDDRTGWHFNWYYQMCFLSDYTHCGIADNYFPTCDACNNKCKVHVCAKKLVPPDSWEPPIGRF
uniref:Putative der and-72 secreted protein n=1 Tax=Rhipicephalus pulchellus TaxID=72859 RepID=L7LVC6_RHIPC